MVESLNDVIFSLDVSGTVTYISPVVESLLGYMPEEIIGQPFGALIYPDDLAMPQSGFERCLQGHSECSEFRILARNGEGFVFLRASGRPMREGEKIVGVIGVLTDISERLKAEIRLSKQSDQLKLLSEIAKKIGQAHEVKEVLERAVELTQNLFGYQHVGIFLIDQERQVLVLRAKAGEFAAVFREEHELDLHQGMVGWVCKHARSLLANDVSAEPSYINLYPDLLPTRSELTVPIRLDDEILGVLDIQSSEKTAFDETDLVVEEALADQIAVALKNARLYQSLAQELAERKLMEEKVENLARFPSGNPYPILRVDKNGVVLYANRAGEALLQDKGGSIGSPAPELWRSTVAETLESGEIKSLDVEQGKLVWSFNVAPVISAGYANFYGSDVTRRVQVERALRESEERFRSAFEKAPVGMVLIHPNGWLLRVNQSFERMVGYREAELMEMNFRTLAHPDNLQTHEEMIRRALSGAIDAFDAELRLSRKDGSEIWALVRSQLLRDPRGDPLYFILHALDITERRRADAELKASLAEKEVLLNEVHHRVKNNLEVILSLADMQSRRLEDNLARESLRLLQERIRTIALVHESLYRTHSLASIHIQKYLHKLTDNLYLAFGTPEVKISIDAADVILSVDTAIPCGLIVTELVTNSLKYAFPAEYLIEKRSPSSPPPEIRVILREEGDQMPGDRTGGDLTVSEQPVSGQLVLEVIDNGIGLAPGFDLQGMRSLGLRLVKSLVGQLHGSLEVQEENGTHFRIKFAGRKRGDLHEQ
jgi:PAS domain S-box-containing protein